ncbi:winged helix DNA-binding domain-containing protein [Mycolicibacterium fortuitum]|uniref:Winged helix DNA-binding domain-containing protein n=2 Tax=Mycolicibacterium fortuitum TaxID=1766 RepID=A0AAE5AGY3_MYCFO|nr:winged helix DNA-binding domain-containing protein [Mycolicibacterium fortuitum]MCV7139996.1 AlkZ family DNA glycosylase [Mycolicibacterium fortuitum]MDV7195461.1 winged helix DNA-binding domain-containing protein [Mycolicibacterium fortuitum]MDV7209348.1 winged helix DNA-binding domain-containing protein [Mycolicibacterium fortuitum]MDV7231180.1 winged helix DNA-binding domain-containing protein [Mycolicibacterium fortuitum]MDV7262581.1 winged helix DNA-binding domain-containing protein [M
MRSFTNAERRARLARRHFLTTPAASVTSTVADFVGLHATDPSTPYLSLWARLPGFTTDSLDRELYERRTVVKHLAMRRTLWIVRAEDLPSVQAGASDRVAGNEHRKLVGDVEKAGVAADGAQWVATACEAVLTHLREHGPTGAAQLRTALPELAGSFNPAPGKRWGGETPLSPRVLTVLGVRGEIVRGPNDSGWTNSRPRWTVTSDWLGAPVPTAEPDQARTELVRTWLRTFGPATVTDIKWWFGNTLTWARHALRDIGAVEVDLDGTPGYVLPDDLDVEPDTEPWAALLPGLDVTTMGWFDRDWYLGAHRPEVFDTNGNGGPTAWWNGRIVGGWGQDAQGRVQLHLLEDVGRDGTRALQHRADALTEWLAGARANPRFPSPLSKRA